MSTIMLEMLENDPKGCLDTVSKFVPREMLIETTIVEQLDEMSDEAIAGEIARLTSAAADLLTAEGPGVETKH